jgi:hypothetical protein
LSFLLIHHLDGDVRAVSLTLVASDASFLLQDLIPFEGEDMGRTDLHTEEASLAVDLVPHHVESWHHSGISTLSDSSPPETVSLLSTFMA